MCSIVGSEMALLTIGVSETAMPAPSPDDETSTSKTGAAYPGAEDSTVTTVGDDVMVCASIDDGTENGILSTLWVKS